MRKLILKNVNNVALLQSLLSLLEISYMLPMLVMLELSYLDQDKRSIYQLTTRQKDQMNSIELKVKVDTLFMVEF